MLEYFTTYNIIIGVSVILNIVLLVGVRNLLRQNEQLEDRLVGTVDSVRNRISDALENMRRLDNREVFEKDDEVGVTFDEMKKIVEELDNEL
tara:strand:- start:2488 stop:2763 length:276 start_codon:yes stop_codon:yes gene_type:complete